jgi:hypothetical protein
MVLKVKKRDQKGEHIRYKSSKKILTPEDIEIADAFDLKLNNTIKKIEDILLDEEILSKNNSKKDPLRVWYIIGDHINKFLKDNKLDVEDENLFWDNLYGRSNLLNKNNPNHKISLTRNDFKTASLLARYPFTFVSSVKVPWALWREILVYKVFQDERIFDWLIQKLIQLKPTRDGARPLLKAIAGRFKKIDTSVLSEEELIEKLNMVSI